MKTTDVLIIGGGLAGLSAASVLQDKKDYLLAEKETRTGGLASSIRKNGFIFDYSGHLLHLHWQNTGNFILKHLKNNYFKVTRNACIRLGGARVAYPFQANLHDLPPAIRSECVRGFLKAYRDYRAHPASRSGELPFKAWALRTFGAGISKYFMLPYNAKLWQYPLDRLTSDWCAPFVPTPDPQELIEGAYLGKKSGLGYNPVFYYPKHGGIQALPDAMASKLSGINLNAELESLNLNDRTAFITGMGPVRYKTLINTMPLKYFLEKISAPPERFKILGKKLKHNSVHVLNLGVKAAGSKIHWTYFTEREFLFYRAGTATNFSKHLAPAGTDSLYIEVAVAPGKAPDLKKAEKKIIQGLVKAGIIKSADHVLEKLWLAIPCAYVIYDRERKKALPEIFSLLKRKNVHSIGRYGAWKYSFMEESVKEGLETAREILDR